MWWSIPKIAADFQWSVRLWVYYFELTFSFWLEFGHRLKISSVRQIELDDQSDASSKAIIVFFSLSSKYTVFWKMFTWKIVHSILNEPRRNFRSFCCWASNKMDGVLKFNYQQISTEMTFYSKRLSTPLWNYMCHLLYTTTFHIKLFCDNWIVGLPTSKFYSPKCDSSKRQRGRRQKKK